MDIPYWFYDMPGDYKRQTIWICNNCGAKLKIRYPTSMHIMEYKLTDSDKDKIEEHLNKCKK